MHDRRLMRIVPRQLPEHPKAAATTHSTDALPNDTAGFFFCFFWVRGGTSAWKTIECKSRRRYGASGSGRQQPRDLSRLVGRRGAGAVSRLAGSRLGAGHVPGVAVTDRQRVLGMSTGCLIA